MSTKKRGPGRPRRSGGSEPLDAAVLVRVNGERKAAYEAAAKARGTTLADVARAAWERLARRASR